MTVNVLVVDDSDIFKKSLTRFLQAYSEVRIVATTDDLKGAVRLCEELKPEVVLVDLTLATGFKAEPFDVECLKNFAQLIAISFSIDEEASNLAEKLGAVRLIDKTQISDQLVPTILEVAQGKSKSKPA